MGILTSPKTPNALQIITTDTLVENVHFLPNDPAESLGHKLVRVNVSDIWAKGAVPTQALLSLGWPMSRPISDLRAFARGFGSSLNEFDINLMGGDTVRSPCIHLSLTLIGECLNTHPITRAGAQINDDIWVSGKIGGGFIGLQDAIAGRDTPAHEHFLRPNLSSSKLVPLIGRFSHASMDVSDGLLQDAGHIAKQSGVGLHIILENVPLYDPTSEAMVQVTGGDDYQILFTASPENSEIFQNFATKIGSVKVGEGTHLYAQGKKISLPDTLGHTHSFLKT